MSDFDFNQDVSGHLDDPRLPLFQAQVESDPIFAKAQTTHHGASFLMGMFQRLGFDGTARVLGRTHDELIQELMPAVGDLVVALGWALTELAVERAPGPEAAEVDTFLANLFGSPEG